MSRDAAKVEVSGGSALPESWRALIDAHIAEKGVTKCPPRTHSEDADWGSAWRTDAAARERGRRMSARARRFEALTLRENEASGPGALNGKAQGAEPARAKTSVSQETRVDPQSCLEKDRAAKPEETRPEAPAAPPAAPDGFQAVRQAARKAGVVLRRAKRKSSGWRPGETVAAGAMAAIAARRGHGGLARVLRVAVAAGLAPIAAGDLKAIEALLFEAELVGELSGAEIAARLGDAAALRARARIACRRSGVPRWRALAVEIFRGCEHG